MMIYLAGGFYKNYKSEVMDEFVGHDIWCVDPELNDKLVHKIPGEYVGVDFEAIRSSDLVLAYLDDYPYVYGMAAEVGYAVAMNKTVILVDVRERVDSFLSGCARAVFTNVPAACRFIKERYAEKDGRKL